MAQEADCNILMDRCWTLLPLSALAAMLAMLIPKNGGLFYVAFMNEFGINRQSATWPLTVHGVITHLAGLLIFLLQRKLPIHYIAVAGSFLNFSSLVAAAFVPNVIWMTVALGVIGGSGCGMIVITLSIYSVLYFDRYRGTASAFKYIGMTLAPLAFPLALSALIRQFNVSGTFLILSAVVLNILPTIMLMNKPRPISLFRSRWFKGPLTSLETKVDGDSGIGELSGTAPFNSKASPLNPPKNNARSSSVARAAFGSCAEQDSAIKATNEVPTVLRAEKGCNVCGKHHLVSETLTQGVLVRDAAKDNVKRKHGIGSDSRESQGNTTGTKVLAIRPHEHGAKRDEEYPIDGDQLYSSPAQSEFVKLFRNPLLYLLVVTFTVSEYIMNTFETTVLDYTLDKGSPRSEAEPVITYIAGAELLGRLTLPLLWDCAKFCRRKLVAICLTITAASLAVLPHVTVFAHVVAVVMITGCSCGCVVALKPVIMSDHLGVEMLPLCWGLAGFVMIPFAFGGPFLIGLFRDYMGSYDNLYRMMSALCIVFAAMVFTSVFFSKRKSREH